MQPPHHLEVSSLRLRHRISAKQVFFIKLVFDFQLVRVFATMVCFCVELITPSGFVSKEYYHSMDFENNYDNWHTRYLLHKGTITFLF